MKGLCHMAELKPWPYTSPEHLRSWARSCDEIAKQYDDAGSTGILEGAAAMAFRDAAEEIERLKRAIRIALEGDNLDEQREFLEGAVNG